MAIPPGRLSIGLGLEVGSRIHRPRLGASCHDTSIAGVINGTDRFALPTQQTTAGCLNRLSHGSASLARIAVDLALGIAAEVITINPETVAVGQGPGPSQHCLGLQRCGRGSGTDLMGNNTFQITLDGDLLHQGPTAVGVPLQSKRTAIQTAFPQQTVRGLDLNRSGESGAPIRSLQHRLHHGGCTAAPVPHAKTIRHRRRLGRPDLPLAGMGNLGRHTDATPALCDPLSRFKAGKRPGHTPGQLNRSIQRHAPPADRDRGGTPLLSGCVLKHQGT